MAASVSVFSIVDGVVMRPLPYRDPDRLVILRAVSISPPYDSNGSISYADFDQFTAKARSFEDLAITYRTGWSAVTLTGGNEPEKVQGAFVSPNLFGMFGRSPKVGRTFTAEENRRGERVVVLSEALSILRFGSGEQAIGRDLEIGGVNWRVIGVVRFSRSFPERPALGAGSFPSRVERHGRGESSAASKMGRYGAVEGRDDTDVGADGSGRHREPVEGGAAGISQGSPATGPVARALHRQRAESILGIVQRGRSPAADRLRQRG